MKPAKDSDEKEILVTEARFVAAIASGSSYPESEVPEVAFAGRSNVGKSSLLNALMNRRNLVRTSSTPGCTRQINLFDATLSDGFQVRFADLPGFGYAKRSKAEKAVWATFIEEYLTKRQALKAIFVVVDVRRGLEEEEQMLLDYVRASRAEPTPIVCVATKTDKLSRAAVVPNLATIGRQSAGRAIGFSAVSFEGRGELWRAIRRCVTASAPRP